MAHSWTLDGAAAATIVGALWGAIPTLAALIGGFYYCLLVYGWFKHRRMSRRPEVEHDGS